MNAWPYQNTPYLSALPGVGGPGLDVSNGDKPSKFYFVRSMENVKEGGPDPRGPNCFSGTWWWCWYADQGEDFSKWMFLDVGGYCYLGRSMNTPEGRDDFDYIGHSAPGAGLFVQTANLRVRASNSRIWHLPSWVGDLPSADGPDSFKADQRDAMGTSSSTDSVNKVAFLSCEGAFAMDETVQVWYDAIGASWIRGAIFHPLHTPPDFAMEEGSHHEAGVDHGFGHLVGGHADYSLAMQSLYAHSTDRNPLVAAPNHAHINNLHYNHGRPYIGRGEAVNIDDNGGHNEAAGRAMQANIVGNMTVRGPNQGDSLTLARVGTVTPGSSGHVAHNSQFGWERPASQEDFITSHPADYLKPTLRRGAWPLGLGFNYDGVVKPARDPLNPTIQEGLAFVQLMRETVGCMPNRRYLYRGGLHRVFNQIEHAIRGNDPPATPQFVDTVAQAGGWPNVPTLSVDSTKPNKWHHAPIPLGADRDDIVTDGVFLDGRPCNGFSKVRKWVIDQDIFVRGR